MKKLLLLVMIFVFVLNTSAQQNFIEGKTSGYRYDCPPGSVLSQSNGDETMATISNTSVPNICAQQVTNWTYGDIGSIRIFGAQLTNDAGWVMCTTDPFDFYIVFYEDDGGMPGNEIMTYSSTISHESTGTYLFGTPDYGYLYYWDWFPSEPVSGLPETFWFSFQNTNSDCYFLWINTPSGNDTGAEYGVEWNTTYPFQYCMSTTYPVTFNVDMNTQITTGDFIPGNDVVYLAGSPWGWTEPGSYTATSLELTDENEDGIYSNTYVITGGEIQYKYYKNEGWGGGEWPGGDSRVYTVTGNENINDLWAYEYLVTFSFFDAAHPVEGALIEIESGTYSGMTNENGLAYFGLTDGIYSYVVTANGYGTSSGTFEVAGENEIIDIFFVNIKQITSEINVYPNPANGSLNIETEESLNMEVFDITGRLINSRVVKGSTQLDLDASGVYFLRFSNAGNSYTMKAVVK